MKDIIVNGEIKLSTLKHQFPKYDSVCPIICEKCGVRLGSEMRKIMSGKSVLTCEEMIIKGIIE